MSKYARAGVTFRDIAAALPTVDLPLQWRLALYPRPQNTTTLSPTLELVYVTRIGATIVFRRWGGGGRTTTNDAVVCGLLLAAQQAAMWMEGMDQQELIRLIRWQLDIR